jgi:hypothetical protein
MHKKRTIQTKRRFFQQYFLAYTATFPLLNFYIIMLPVYTKAAYPSPLIPCRVSILLLPRRPLLASIIKHAFEYLYDGLSVLRVSGVVICLDVSGTVDSCVFIFSSVCSTAGTSFFFCVQPYSGSSNNTNTSIPTDQKDFNIPKTSSLFYEIDLMYLFINQIICQSEITYRSAKSDNRGRCSIENRNIKTGLYRLKADNSKKYIN